MANNPLETTLLDRAIVFAVKAHSGTFAYKEFTELIDQVFGKR